MFRTFASALTISLFLSACTKSEKTSEIPTDSTAAHTEDYSAFQPTYVYNRASTFEGQFDKELQEKDTVSREGLLGLAQTIALADRKDMIIRGGDYTELELVMFSETPPIFKLTNCERITFVNIYFNSQYAYQSLIDLANCTDVTFDGCRFLFDQQQAIAQSNTTNVVFNDCTFGGLPYSNQEEPTLEEQSDSDDEGYDGEEESNDDDAYSENESSDENTQQQSTEQTNYPDSEALMAYPSESWESPISTVTVPNKQENLNFFSTNPYFTVNNPQQMNYASYSALEFGRAFLSPIDWTKENDTWKEGSEIEGSIPEDCENYQKMLSLTRARKKIIYLHRKLSFGQEAGIDSDDKWRDDKWYQNRSYYYYLFVNRGSTFMEGVWRAAKPYLENEVTLTKQEYKDAEVFVDELLLYYAKVTATPGWDDRFYHLSNNEINLSTADYFHQAGFPVHENVCMREGYTGGNYINGYDWGTEAWMYGFWLRRHKEGNMELVRNILLWAKSELSKQK